MPEEQSVQLNVWIPKDLKEYLAEKAKQNNKSGMNSVVAELIRQERAREQGEIIEQQSLPVLQEIVRKEVRQALAEQRKDLRDDREEAMEALRKHLNKGFNRIAALSVHIIRNAGIGRRLTYTLLAKAYDAEFATSAFEDAKAKVHRELMSKMKEDDE
ncbi:hypothetical protein [Dictyobacter kobayashii]|uniref:Arc-like DNA binding domain-containing protein n=1 Tax=Dictyobacter kobayashii TaxID=2014872 RepID=A0A402AK85_9CHLR|nr:hypothetical protein [Dictyobacter kobayashii]GCE19547.1 hypothetical protein KDK_33470 [Dictyobacter kobayashii]